MARFFNPNNPGGLRIPIPDQPFITAEYKNAGYLRRDEIPVFIPVGDKILQTSLSQLPDSYNIRNLLEGPTGGDLRAAIGQMGSQVQQVSGQDFLKAIPRSIGNFDVPQETGGRDPRNLFQTPSGLQTSSAVLPKVGDLIPGGGGLKYEASDIANLGSGAPTPGIQPSVAATGAQQSSQTGDPTLDALLGQLRNFLDEMKRRGQVLNPNIELSPEKAAEFLKQAESEINPYYSSQLALAREGLMRTLGYSTEEVLRNEQELERKYGQAVKDIASSSAEQGFAQSGIRNLAEQDLARSTQFDIDTNRRNLGFQAGTLGRTFAQQYGAPPSIPTIAGGPRALPGQLSFARDSRSLPLYELSPNVYEGLVGEQEFQRRGAIQTRKSQLEGAQRTLDALGQYRQLVI